jgi:2-polyprenyl-3-methyl-5-hydroxy-6-metoxy-1,4-benzoquinol methylase
MTNQWFIERKKCPVCLSETFTTFYQSAYDNPPVKDYLIDFYSSQGKIEFEYLEGATYALCNCKKCGSVFQRDIPNNFLMERLYKHWLDPDIIYKSEQKVELPFYTRCAQEIMQIIAYFKKEPSGLCFLDFGMGWGRWALIAKAFGCDSYGYELSEACIKNARSHGIKVIKWQEIANHQFDFINTEQVFEHIPEPGIALNHLRLALKQGGILKISVPTANNIKRRLKKMDFKVSKGKRMSVNPVAPLEHINYFRRTSIIKMAENAGMKEVFIPLNIQYRFTTDWSSAEKIFKNLYLPLAKNFFRNRNYVFLQNIE